MLAIIDSPCLSTFPLLFIIYLDQSTKSFFFCRVESTHPFAARVVDSRPSVLLHPSGGHNCLTRCRLQMFLKPQVCVEYGNRTREHQSGHQSSYWLWTSVLNFSDLTRTGVTHSPPHTTSLHPTPL